MVVHLPWLVNFGSLVRAVYQWLSGRVSALLSVVAGSVTSSGDQGMNFWTPDKVETAVQCSVCHMEVLTRFSSHGNSIDIYIYIYIYIFTRFLCLMAYRHLFISHLCRRKVVVLFNTFHIFPKVISRQVNVIPSLEFELAYNDVAMQHVSHYTMGTSSYSKSIFIYKDNHIHTIMDRSERKLGGL